MMRVACLLIPHLPVQVEQRRNPVLADAPLVVGGRRWDVGAVLDCCVQAAAAGVEPGMRLSRAETLCPDARFVPADEGTYDAVHEAVADSVRRFTATVEIGELGLVLANVSGLKRRFDDEAELAGQLIQGVGDSLGSALSPVEGPVLSTSRVRSRDEGEGLDVQVGLGGSKFVAERAARAARPGEACVVPPEEEQAFLSPLDISALPLGPEMERRLRLLGVRTLGALANLPRLAVIRQFGSHAGVLYDMACGRDDRCVHADAPPLQLSRSHAFIDPVGDRAPLLAHVGRMTGDLAEELNCRGYQAEGMRLEVVEAAGEGNAVGKPVKPPSSSADQLSRLGARMLGSMAIDGPVTDLSITVYPLRPFHQGATQLTLFRDGGPRACPERSGRNSPTFDRALRETLRRLWERFGELSVVVASLLVPPEPSPIQVTTDSEGLPRAIVWRQRIREVRHVCELWRERRRWWARPIERDYFRLELDDGQMRTVFRDVQANRWLLERRHI